MDHTDPMKKLLLIFVLISLGACAPQTRYPHIVTTEAQMVQDCQYLNTFAENADPGRFLPKYRINDAEQKVLHRADRVGATHVVWSYDYQRIGSAALIYRCDD